MRVFVAGGTGAIGRYLVPQLVAAGHEVVATTRTPAKLELLWDWGATGVVADGLDAGGMMRAVADAKPDVVVHEMTALASVSDLRHFEKAFAVTNRLRTEGTDHLLAAARAAGVRRLVAASFTGWTNSREGAGLATESDPLDAHPIPAMRSTFDAIAYLERTVTAARDLDGLVLRYGGFYGPEAPQFLDAVRKRQMPIVAGGNGVMPLVHLADAASATVAAVAGGAPGIYNVADDDPAAFSEWLPYLADLFGAKPPRHVPAWLARLVAGPAAVRLLDSRGVSNAKAKAELGWHLRYPSWRDGFRCGLGTPTAGTLVA